jgi:hypothetical protein
LKFRHAPERTGPREKRRDVVKPRPLGVTILAVLLFLNVGTYGALIVMAIHSPDQLAVLLQGMMPGSSVGPSPLLQLGAFLPVFFLAIAIFMGLLGRGLWRLKNWARIVVLFLVVASAAIGIVEVARNLSGMDATAWISAIAQIAISVLVALYLSSAKVRAAFGKAPRAPDR